MRPSRAAFRSGAPAAPDPAPAQAVAPAAPGFPRDLVLGLLAAAGLGLLTINPLLTAGSFVAAAAIVALLWRSGAPPVLLFVAGMLWLQAAMKVLHADVLELPVTRMALHPATIEKAILLSLLSTVVIAIGMRVGMGPVAPDAHARLTADAPRLSVLRLAAMTLLVGAATSLAEAYTPQGARQLVVALTSLKWVFMFALACTVFLERRGYLALGTVALIELVVGFTGFFSDFKSVLFVLLLAALTAQPRISLGRLPRLLAGVAAIVVLGLVWTAIKSDMRTFLNAGTGEQVVLRSPTERLEGLVGELGSLDGSQLAAASEALAERLAYVDFFAIVLDRIPLVMPHEDGALLGAAVRHILTPRILFPDKPVTGSDSDMTNRYTGLNLASGRQGTSVNLGWPAETYIDFGPVLMFVPMFGIGLVCGLVYRSLAGSDRSITLSYGLAVAALIAVPAAGTLLKLLGGLVTNMLVLGAIRVTALPSLARLLRSGPGG